MKVEFIVSLLPCDFVWGLRPKLRVGGLESEVKPKCEEAVALL